MIFIVDFILKDGSLGKVRVFNEREYNKMFRTLEDYFDKACEGERVLINVEMNE